MKVFGCGGGTGACDLPGWNTGSDWRLGGDCWGERAAWGENLSGGGAGRDGGGAGLEACGAGLEAWGEGREAIESANVRAGRGWN